MIFLAKFGMLLLITLVACTGKNKIESQALSSGSLRQMPGNCEDCELMFEGIPEHINSIDTTDGWHEEGQRLVISGKIFQPDQTTPASGVILYYYHTDQKGFYAPGSKSDAGSSRHGRLRGWIKTGPDGSFAIHTSRPAQYPSNTAEAHIHVMVKEPDMDNPYWTDAWVFDDDPLLTPQIRQRLENRGGSGIMKPHMENGIQVAEQNIILGLNIPGYPLKK